MTKVVSLKPEKVEFEEEVNAETVRVLETWLEKAKAGKLDGVALCGALRNGDVITQFTNTDNFHQITSGIALLQHRRLESRNIIDSWED